MMYADQSTLSRCTFLLFFAVMGIPGTSRSATLEDSASEMARKIAAALPARQDVSCEIRNISSLRADEVARIEQALKAQLQEQGIRLSENSSEEITLKLTLSQNWKEFIWTGEIRQRDASHTVLLAVSRAGENQVISNAMHVTVRGEKFWEGPERILDAAEFSNGGGKSWFVSLQPASLAIQDLQTGSIVKVDIGSGQSTRRDPWGQLGSEQTSNVIWFAILPQVCKVDLETRSITACVATRGATEGGPLPDSFPFPLMMDPRPVNSPSPGKVVELAIMPVCGGTDQFLTTSERDYTQTDSLQVFQREPNGPVAMSGELDFPGPIVALHTALDAPRAIVRNLTTGNYEAYRLAISCGQ